MNNLEKRLKDAVIKLLNNIVSVKLIDAERPEGKPEGKYEKFQVIAGESVLFESDPMVIEDFIKLSEMDENGDEIRDAIKGIDVSDLK